MIDKICWFITTVLVVTLAACGTAIVVAATVYGVRELLCS